MPHFASENDDSLNAAASISRGDSPPARASRQLDPIADEFSRIEADYSALRENIGIVDRSDLCVLEITGNDRAAWLHNLTTNHVKTLQPGQGNQAFALNGQGRVLFDLVVLIRTEQIWAVIHRDRMPLALKHFCKYIITEDVRLTDRSMDLAILACVGPKAAEALSSHGVREASTAPLYSLYPAPGIAESAAFYRDDFCGQPAFAIVAPAELRSAVLSCITSWTDPSATGIVCSEALEILRIESALPKAFCEITEEYLPGEIGFLGRFVSYQKGCYLGQEVVERMRSRGVVARSLVCLQMCGAISLPSGTPLLNQDGKSVGVVTSSCRSIQLGGALISLAFVKTAYAAHGTHLRAVQGADGVAVDCTVVASPLHGSTNHD